MRTLRIVVLLAGLTCIAPAVVSAHEGYKIQPIVALGGVAGDVTLPKRSDGFFLGPLTDDGRLLFDIGTLEGTIADTVLQYADGIFTPVIVPGRPGGPEGNWPDDVLASAPFSMNQRGDFPVALARIAKGAYIWTGTYLWEREARRLRPLLLRGMPATGNFVVIEPGGFAPTLNNRGDLVLIAGVKDPAGPSGHGIYFLGQDGRLQPILVPGQTLPGGKKHRSDLYPHPEPSLDETGAVAFLAQRLGEPHSSAYRWEQGALSPLLLVGADAPEGAKVTSVSQVLLNSRNRHVTTAVAVGGSGNHGLYRLVEGSLQPIAAPGQEMPGGGRFRSLQNVYRYPEGARCLGISTASSTGEHVFLAQLEDGGTAAYKMDADGKLALVVKSGATSELGTITKVKGAPASINSRGQVALVVDTDRGANTLILLTPTSG